MTTTAPSKSLLIIKQRHLMHKINHRPAASFFQAPLYEFRQLTEINNRLAITAAPATPAVESEVMTPNA